jgi:hypothetical protein
MAATAWALYYTAKKFIGDGTFDLDATGGDDYKVALMKSTYTPSLGNENWADISNHELASGEGIVYGYTAGGKAVTGNTYEQTAGVAAWKIDNPYWDAAGGNITGIRHAVIYHIASGKLVCYSTLDTTDITINDGTRLTIQIHASGVFTNT